MLLPTARYTDYQAIVSQRPQKETLMGSFEDTKTAF